MKLQFIYSIQIQQQKSGLCYNSTAALLVVDTTIHRIDNYNLIYESSASFHAIVRRQLRSDDLLRYDESLSGMHVRIDSPG